MKWTQMLLSMALAVHVAGSGARGQPEITVELPGGSTMEMIWIEPGAFRMGTPESDQYAMRDEMPQHDVTISRGGYVGKYEITQRQWQAVMNTRPWEGQSYVTVNPDNPAVYISWDDVQAFIHRLNEAAGDSLYRLPTEAEWEYTCRAGTTTRWSFGDDPAMLPEHAWYRENTFVAGETWAHPVGMKAPNPWGLYDMHGNVWEWVQDWLGKYRSHSQVDPTGPETGTYRVVRSGIFMAAPPGTRSAFRYAGSQDFPDGGVGARLWRRPFVDTSVRPESWGRVKGHPPLTRD